MKDLTDHSLDFDMDSIDRACIDPNLDVAEIFQEASQGEIIDRVMTDLKKNQTIQNNQRKKIQIFLTYLISKDIHAAQKICEKNTLFLHLLDKSLSPQSICDFYLYMIQHQFYMVFNIMDQLNLKSIYFFMGQPLVKHIQENESTWRQETHQISKKRLFDNFHLALISKQASIVGSMLVKAPSVLKNYLRGNFIQTAEDGNIEKMPMIEIIDLFWDVLHEENIELCKIMWENIPDLHQYFSGQPLEITSNHHTSHRIKQATISEIVQAIKRFTKMNFSEVILSIFENNPFLATCFGIHTVKYQKTNQAGSLDTCFFQLSMDEFVDCFKQFVMCHSKNLIEEVWKINHSSYRYFCGQAIEIVKFNTDETQETQTAQLPLHKVVAYFSLALSSRSWFAIKTIWNNNDALVHYFSGKTRSVSLFNDQRSMKKFINQFTQNLKLVLNSQHKEFIDAVWQDNPVLIRFFIGQNIQLKLKKKQMTWRIKPNQLLEHFEAIVASHHAPTIKSILTEGAQARLTQAIHALDNKKLTHLMDRLLVLNILDDETFITVFLQKILNTPICLRYLKTKNSNEKHPNHQIKTNPLKRKNNEPNEETDTMTKPFKHAHTERSHLSFFKEKSCSNTPNTEANIQYKTPILSTIIDRDDLLHDGVLSSLALHQADQL